MTRSTRASLVLACTVLALTGWRLHAAVSSRVSASMGSNQSVLLPQGTASYLPALSYSVPFTDGTSTNQFKIVYADSGTIAASDSILLDLAGSKLDAFGTTITCVTLKGLMVTAKATNTNNVLVGGAKVAQIQFLDDTTDVVPVKPGGVFLWAAPGTGATVTAGSRDIIRIKNSGATTGVGYSLQVLCR